MVRSTRTRFRQRFLMHGRNLLESSRVGRPSKLKENRHVFAHQFGSA
jgi:hypothetical protein